ncbi:hypothetical protein SAMN05216339_1255 [Nitrosomonas eutropha]|uniref:Uncharacterized protein n=1 Tax=Nitrosomonas eutropha TaxID=916 RepID=A0A1I7JG08_9PROT|nr:hypothetical protein SAMN05216339_1255 [Nitrosomonas eutropha]
MEKEMLAGVKKLAFGQPVIGMRYLKEKEES